MIRINLLPIRAQKRKDNVRKQGVFLVVYFVLLIAVVTGIHLSLMSEADAKRKKIEGQKKEIVRLDQIIKEVQNYKAKLADLTDKLNTVVGLEQSQRGPARVFKELASTMPEKLWIEKMTDRGGFLTLEGYAIDQQTIAEFMMKLENNGNLKYVKLSVTKKANKGGTDMQSFVINTNVQIMPVNKSPAPAAGKAG